MSRLISYVLVFLVGFGVCAWVVYHFYGSPRDFARIESVDIPRGGLRIAATGPNQVRTAAELVGNYVVNIDTVGQPVRTIPDFFGLPFGGPEEFVPRGQASGVIFSPDGYILTNNHVVEGAQLLSVTLHDGKRFQARLVGRDPRQDLAVIKIEASNLPYAKFGNSDTLAVGDWVIAVGNALGFGPTVTIGVVSAKRREFDIDGRNLGSVIQTDAAINRGNSGGALADLNGSLVGINTAIASTSPGGGSIGIGFAIPSKTAERIAKTIVERGRVARPYVAPRPWLGIRYMALNDETRRELMARGVRDLPSQDGARIVSVVSGSPAAQAGLQPDDVIVKVNGKRVSGDGETSIRDVIDQADVGDRIILEVWKAQSRTTEKVAVRLGKAPEGLGR